MVGNGFFHDDTNVAGCYDGGDCCGNCVVTGHCEDCACLAGVLDDGITNTLVGDGVCNDETNNAECDYDGGDCCPNSELVANSVCNDENNMVECDYDGGDCCPNPNMVGDAICHDETNHLGCNYDGGDCCLIVRISLTNEILNAGSGGYLEYFNGDYEISIMSNGQTSWINGDYAIWYNSGYWLFGNLADIDELTGYMYAVNDFYGLTDDENEWNYWGGNSWKSPADLSDIQITCVDEY